MIVALAVFGYYIWELRRDTKKKTRTPLLSGVVSVIMLLGWMVIGFSLTGSPAYQRNLRLDEQRVSDLQTIQSQVINYWQQKESLPSTLEDLHDSISGFEAPLDPHTQAPYEYTVTGEFSFELCAMFAETSVASNTYENRVSIPIAGSLIKTDNWMHTDGYVCFDRTIDPDLYKTVE